MDTDMDMDRDRAVRAVSAVVVGVVLAACGSGGEPGPIPRIEGVYLGVWSLAVENDRVSCPAGLTITDQSDSTFRTSFEILRRDGAGLSCIDTIGVGSGVVRADRTITALAETVEPVTCSLDGPNRGLSGTVRGDSITVSGRYTYRCPQEFTWTLGFAGSRAEVPLPPYPDVRGTYTGPWATLVLGLLVTCPATLTLETQDRDDVVGTYTLAEAGSCVAQAPQPLTGTITVDGNLRVVGVPPISAGCTLERALSLSGTTAGGMLNLTGGFALLCGGVVREFAVSVALDKQ